MPKFFIFDPGLWKCEKFKKRKTLDFWKLVVAYHIRRTLSGVVRYVMSGLIKDKEKI